MIALAGRVARGGFTAELDLQVEPGEVVGVLGENGAGKSTLLRVLAGLTPLDEGTLRLGDRVVDDPSAGVFVSPDERPTGVVLQRPTLFPHLDLRDNAAFGLRRRGQAPKPPLAPCPVSPRGLSGSESTSTHCTASTRWTTNWAIRSPRLT